MNLIKASQSSLETQNSYVNAGLVKPAESPLFLILLPALRNFAVVWGLSPLTQPSRNAASQSRALSAKEWTEESKLGSSSAVAAPSRLLNGLV